MFEPSKSKTSPSNDWCTVSHIMMTCLLSKGAVGKAVRAGLAVEGASRTILRSDLVFSRRYKNGAGRNRRATRRPAHFQRNPPGRGQLAVFPSGGCRTRLTRMNPDMGALPPVRLGPP